MRSYRGRYIRAMANGDIHYWPCEAISEPPSKNAAARGVISLAGATIAPLEAEAFAFTIRTKRIGSLPFSAESSLVLRAASDEDRAVWMEELTNK